MLPAGLLLSHVPYTKRTQKMRGAFVGAPFLCIYLIFKEIN